MQSPASPKPEPSSSNGSERADLAVPARPLERGGPPGPEPTRFGDWEKAGRCIDF